MSQLPDCVDTAYAEVVKRVPDLVNATLRRRQTTAAKWYGSHEEMFAFARSGAEALPDGHPLLALSPIAHIELHLDKTSKGGKPARLWEIVAYYEAGEDDRLELSARPGRPARPPRSARSTPAAPRR